MKASLSTRSAVLVVGTAAATVLATGVSYAVWSVTGSGTGSATAGVAQPVDVTVAVSSGTLHPGASLWVIPTFTNPNAFPVTVTGVTPGPVTVSGAAGCTADTSGVSFKALTGPWTVPARTASGNGTLAGPAVVDGVTMSTASDTACQGATFTAKLTVVGSSS